MLDFLRLIQLKIRFKFVLLQDRESKEVKITNELLAN
jgi:hypothetical protein